MEDDISLHNMFKDKQEEERYSRYLTLLSSMCGIISYHIEIMNFEVISQLFLTEITQLMFISREYNFIQLFITFFWRETCLRFFYLDLSFYLMSKEGNEEFF